MSDALRALIAAATPGPWTTQNEYLLRKGCRCLSCYEDEPYGVGIPELDGLGNDPNPILRYEDAAFIAAARTELPAALDEVDRLEAELAQSRTALAQLRTELAEARMDLSNAAYDRDRRSKWEHS